MPKNLIDNLLVGLLSCLPNETNPQGGRVGGGQRGAGVGGSIGRGTKQVKGPSCCSVSSSFCIACKTFVSRTQFIDLS